MRYRQWFAFVTVLAVAGCGDITAPQVETDAEAAVPEWLGAVASAPVPESELSVLRQAPSGPPLETYQVAFWARRGKASFVKVDYQPAEGESQGRRFMRFYLPEDGLKSIPGQRRLSRSDSVLITATIDPVTFSIDFQPSGVVFDKRRPALLFVWLGNADPDLNRDGLVDATDETLRDQLAIWTRNGGSSPWRRLMSRLDVFDQVVFTAVYHFSEFAISW